MPLVALLLRRTFRPAEVITIFGLAVLIFTELFYFIDSMGDVYYRMNTVFKLGLVAWMMMSTGAFLWLGEWLTQHLKDRSAPTWAVRAGAGAIVLLLICAPVLIPDLTYGYGGKTLDGLAWVDNSHPGDAAAVAYLSACRETSPSLRPRAGIMHTSPAYRRSPASLQSSACVSRDDVAGGYDAGVSQRMADVRMIYEDPTRSPSLLATYGGVDYLVRGEIPKTSIIPSSFLRMSWKKYFQKTGPQYTAFCRVLPEFRRNFGHAEVGFNNLYPPPLSI